MKKKVFRTLNINNLKHFIVTGIVLGGFFGFFGCNTLPRDTEEKKQDLSLIDTKVPMSWNEIMQKLEQNMVDLFPLMVNSRDFQNKNKQERILVRLENLKILSQKANHSPMLKLNDPSISFVTFDFQSQIQLTKSAFESGNKEFARMEFLKTTQFCIECHTQTQKGPQFGSEKMNSYFSQMSLLDQAEVYTATRKFDKAIEKYLEFFELKQVNWEAQFRSENALHNALSVLIRYKRDPLETGKFLQVVENCKFIPLYLKSTILVWKEDIKSWSLFHQRQIKFKQIKSWMEKSDARRLDYGNLGGEIWNLLAISYLHEILDHWQDGKTKEYSKAEIFLLLGVNYINSTTHFQTSLGSKYLESCIRIASHTPNSMKCYRKLEEYIYDMNSGTAGTFMSVNDEMLLKELKTLAE